MQSNCKCGVYHCDPRAVLLTRLVYEAVQYSSRQKRETTPISYQLPHHFSHEYGSRSRRSNLHPSVGDVGSTAAHLHGVITKDMSGMDSRPQGKRSSPHWKMRDELEAQILVRWAWCRSDESPLVTMDLSRSTEQQCMERLDAFVERVPLEQRSEEFKRERARILNLIQDPETRQHVANMVVPVTLKDMSAVKSVLDRLVELAHIQTLGTEHTACMFCFKRIQLDFRYKAITDGIIASVIRYALTDGLYIDELRLGRIESHTHRLMLLASQNARQHLTTTECGGSPLGFMRMFLGSLSESATLGSYGASKDAFKSVCSSFLLPESAAIRRFECSMGDLGEPGDSQHIRWFWLLYGLFSHRARHSITSLDIFARNIQVNDMARVRDFVSAPRPLELMKNSDSAASSSNPTEDFSHVVLVNDAPVYSADGSLCVFSASDTTNTFDVMGTPVDAEMVDILVPGFGHCKVKHVDILRKHPRSNATVWRLDSHSITTLNIELFETIYDGLVHILELIGTPVTKLSIVWDDWSNSQIEAIPFEAINQVCPDLSSLNVQGLSFATLSTLVDAYATKRCSVTHLALTSCAIHEPLSLISFAKALGDPEQPISRTLRKLKLRLSRDFMTDEVIEAFALMLKTNRFIRLLELSLSRTQRMRFGQYFEPHNQEFVPGGGVKLALVSKFAFLSVLHSPNSPVSKSMARMDTNIFRNIFELARYPKVREVVLRYHN